MKKTLILLLGFTNVITAFAQWTSGTNINNTNSGNVGIGTSSPAAKLHVNSTILAEYAGATTDLPNLRLYNGSAATNIPGEYRADLYIHNSTGQLTFRNVTGKGYNFINATATSSLLNVLDNGNVGIGTTSPQALLDVAGNAFISGSVGIGTTNTYSYKLAVNGSAIFTEVKVKLNANWPDYVFKNNYKLLSLKDLENYISINNHLPNIPSAVEIEKEGINLGEMNAKLLEKIEELTLYIIQLKKENEEIKEELKKLSEKK